MKGNYLKEEEVIFSVHDLGNRSERDLLVTDRNRDLTR